MSEEMFKEAVKAAKAGERVKAKDLFTRLIKADSAKVDYWLWMSALVETEKEQIFCLQNALKIDPNSTAARRGLVVLGALRPEEAGLSAAPSIEEAAVEMPSARAGQGSGALGGLDVFLSRPRNRQMVMLVGGTAALLAVVICAIAFLPSLLGGLRPTQVAGVTNTPTLAPTDTPAPTTTITPTAVVNPCSAPADPVPSTPLAAYLCLTQVPTPLLIATEPSVAEAYTTMKRGYADGDWQKILNNEAQVKELLPDSARVYFYVAEAYRQTGNTRSALSNYTTATQKDANFAPAFWGKAVIEVAQNQTSAALRDWENAIKADPNFVSPYIDRANYYTAIGRADNALADMEAARLVAPSNALVMATLANVYVDNGLAQQGLEAAQQALTIDPGMALAYYARGRAQYMLGEFKTAEADLSLAYRYVVALDAPFPSLHQATVLYNVALGKIGVGDDATALTLLIQALDLYEAFPQAHLARGQIYLRAEDYENARPDFNTAISQFQAKDSDNPAIFEAYMGNGLAFLGLGRPDSAVTNFQLVARNQPENFQAFLFWGQALVLSGGNSNADKAVEPLTIALGLTQTEADSAQVFHWRARAYQILRRTAEELADLTALTALDAQDLAPTAEARLTEIGPLPTATTSGPTGTPTRPSRTPTPTRTP